MELWIPVTVAAAFLQNLRMVFQKQLKSSLTTGGATYSRFVFALPFAIVFAAVMQNIQVGAPPEPNAQFVLYCALGGVAQIMATGLLVAIFSHRNFAVGTAYSKTETVQTVFLGLILLGESVSGQALIGILISLLGVLAISFAQTGWNRYMLRDLVGKPALTGIASGTCLAMSVVCYRAGSLSLGGDGFMAQASLTLAVALVIQCVVMALWLKFREPGQAMATIRAWRIALPAGLSGFAASACWFVAMTIQNAAYVRALGQVELVFTFAASWFIFKERSKPAEVLGVALICGGIVVLVLR